MHIFIANNFTPSGQWRNKDPDLHEDDDDTICANKLPSAKMTTLQTAFVQNGAAGLRMSANGSPTKACVRQRTAVALAAAALAGTLATGAVIAAPKLPPIDMTARDRCVPLSSAMGQANAARDKLLDLRECALGGLKFHGDLSGALLAGADLTGADLVGVQLSKAYAVGAQLAGADLTNAVVDRVDFSGADLHGAIFANAVLSDTVFEGANVEVRHLAIWERCCWQTH